MKTTLLSITFILVASTPGTAMASPTKSDIMQITPTASEITKARQAISACVLDAGLTFLCLVFEPLERRASEERRLLEEVFRMEKERRALAADFHNTGSGKRQECMNTSQGKPSKKAKFIKDESGSESSGYDSDLNDYRNESILPALASRAVAEEPLE